jgi:hypothetical protein
VHLISHPINFLTHTTPLLYKQIQNRENTHKYELYSDETTPLMLLSLLKSSPNSVSNLFLFSSAPSTH